MDNGHEPATKADLKALDERVEILRSEVHHSYSDLREQLRDSETNLLKAFYSFAQTNTRRLTDLEGTDVLLRTRVTALEERMLDLERRFNLPPG